MSDPATPSGFSWGRLVRLFGPHRARVATVVVLVFVTAVAGIVNPLLIQKVFDDALFIPGGPDLPLLWTLTVVMIGVVVVAGGLGVVQTVVTNRLGQDVLLDLRNTVYGHLQTLSLRFYGTARTGDLQSRLSSDVGGVQTAVTVTLSSVLSNAITLVSAVVAMAVLSWPLTIVTIATVPLFVAATRAVGRRREAYTTTTQRATADVMTITQETLSVSGVTLSKLYGRQDAETARFGEANRRLAAATTRQQAIGQAFFSVVQTFLGATPVIVYLIVGLLINGGTALTAGTVVAFTTLQNRLFFPVARLLETTVELQSSRAMFRRIFEYLDTEPDIVERPDALALDPVAIRGELGFDDVYFGYDPSEPVIRGINFTARPGALVALVGPSGAGKSTMLNLIARLYDPDAGAVRLDGIDLRQLSFASLSTAIGMVTQENYLFADSLRANIAYGQPDATDDEIEKAARAAAIHDRILELPEGYDTLVGERGFRLSGGERQRIAIARVLLHDPRVLVLDEATSALDSVSERKIQAALGELISGRTTIAVAHRLSTIQAADVIHVVERGRIIESGTHNQLLAANGSYRRLYDEQFGGGTRETECADGVVWADGRC
ncbi:MAG TPA: ABC transporter ATP-binding protein, partial [Acidimicrobiales bacterium]|nr:ABC transporter ATP-binding protein [Acidimicrobiales bacterium]